ncbi:hypothetical protein PR048_004646 [Dryococelus australis]|uniref:Uncharacterized protein n=1 Tax=Dryococelus australis TaxID=614101 RepID=A0ABQ9I614_9NEOP|nr:hypothetical protein PR048_004646 [Dryococelus australis]
MKKKFPCLNYLRIQPIFAANIFKCCVALCNFSRDANEDVGLPDGENEEGNIEGSAFEDDDPILPAAFAKQPRTYRVCACGSRAAQRGKGHVPRSHLAGNAAMRAPGRLTVLGNRRRLAPGGPTRSLSDAIRTQHVLTPHPPTYTTSTSFCLREECSSATRQTRNLFLFSRPPVAQSVGAPPMREALVRIPGKAWGCTRADNVRAAPQETSHEGLAYMYQCNTVAAAPPRPILKPLIHDSPLYEKHVAAAQLLAQTPRCLMRHKVGLSTD